jgi:(-)-germacrene D synthase
MKDEQHVQQLKEEVKRMLMAPPVKDSLGKLELIDDIQRLGVSYHFEYEIDQTLQQIHDSFKVDYCDDDLHTCALRFRLLRQQGYCVSCGNVVIHDFLYIPINSFCLK